MRPGEELRYIRLGRQGGFRIHAAASACVLPVVESRRFLPVLVDVPAPERKGRGRALQESECDKSVTGLCGECFVARERPIRAREQTDTASAIDRNPHRLLCLSSLCSPSVVPFGA